MVLFDQNGVLKRYEDVRDILKEFYDLRLVYYAKRKRHMEDMLGAEALKLSNQARFIMEKCDKSLVVENKKRKIILAELVKKGYDPNPLKKLKKAEEETNSQSQEDNGDDSDPEVGEKSEDAKANDYDYLLSMSMWNLTQEKKDELLKKRDDKRQELEVLKNTSKETLWRNISQNSSKCWTKSSKRSWKIK